MASVLALKRIFSSNLLPTYFRLALRPVTASPSASRLFSTGSASSPGQEDGPRSVDRGRGWGTEETEESLYLRMGMPGLGNDDVDVFVEGRNVIVKGKGKNAVVDRFVNTHTARSSSRTLVAGSLSLRSLTASSPISGPWLAPAHFASRCYLTLAGDEKDGPYHWLERKHLFRQRGGNTIVIGEKFTLTNDEFVERKHKMIPYAKPWMTRGVLGCTPGWKAQENHNVLCLRYAMPDLTKEDVQISVKGRTLVVNILYDKIVEENIAKLYESWIDLADKKYNLDGIVVRVKDGVLMIWVRMV